MEKINLTGVSGWTDKKSCWTIYIRKGGRELVLPAVPGYMALCENQFCIYDLYSSVPDAVHPPDPFHLIVGFQRFRNALCICHLFYQSFEHLLCLPVNICKIGIQFTAGQQIGISHTVALSEIAEMPLPPYPDWLAPAHHPRQSDNSLQPAHTSAPCVHR